MTVLAIGRNKIPSKVVANFVLKVLPMSSVLNAMHICVLHQSEIAFKNSTRKGIVETAKIIIKGAYVLHSHMQRNQKSRDSEITDHDPELHN
ncbi:hypothetical protein J437_LFUL008727 [Ladona fulva]|uniref:Uncharacterized protein n=1 Tax=Ladona fulva TaxID=123851 RepID=A0A8K0K6V2_LADFU|nr:hypothetical protein J437_LFUL008727 [Ladona fulva]